MPTSVSCAAGARARSRWSCPRAGSTRGPEPVIGAQRIVLRLGDQQLQLATDGLGPFAVVDAEAPP